MEEREKVYVGWVLFREDTGKICDVHPAQIKEEYLNL